jgi:hypothetical protein
MCLLKVQLNKEFNIKSKTHICRTFLSTVGGSSCPAEKKLRNYPRKKEGKTRRSRKLKLATQEAVDAYKTGF